MIHQLGISFDKKMTSKEKKHKSSKKTPAEPVAEPIVEEDIQFHLDLANQKSYVCGICAI